MIEAYKIGVSLAMTGNIQSVVAQLSKDFEALNRVVKSMQMSVNELASGLRGLQRIGASAAAEWSRVAQAMERAAKAAQSAAAVHIYPAANSNGQMATAVGGGGSRSAGGGYGGLVAAGAAGAAVGAVGRAVGGGYGGGPPRGPLLAPPGGGGGGGGIPLTWGGGPARPGSHDFAIAAAGFGAAGYGALRTEASMFAAAAEIGAIKARMKMAGYTDAQIEASMSAARTQARAVPGLTLAGAMHTQLDLRTITGNPDAGPEAIAELSKLGLTLAAGGKGDQTAELYAAIQAGELRGAIVDPTTHKVDMGRFTQFLRNIQAAAVATGYRFGPREILQTLRSGGISAAALSDRSLFADQVLPALTLGAAGGGTALQGFGMQFGAGKMSEAAGNMLSDMGLLVNPRTGLPLTPNKLKKYKTGVGQMFLPPNVLRGRQEALDAPADFIERFLVPGLDKYLKNKGIAPDDQQRMLLAQGVASRIPGGKYIADFIRLHPLVEREREQFAAAQGRDAYSIRVESDPQLRVQAMNAAFHNMMAEMGSTFMDDAIKAMSLLTDGMNALGKWAQEHPDTAKRIAEVAAVLGSLSVAIAGIAGALFVAGPMIRVATWMAGSASAGAAIAGGAAGAAASTGLRAIPGIGALWGVNEFGGAAAGWLGDRVFGPQAPGTPQLPEFRLFDPSTWPNLGRRPTSFAPRAAASGGDRQGAVPVFLINPGDLMSGVTGGLSRDAARPPTGPSFLDLRTGMFGGLVPGQ